MGRKKTVEHGVRKGWIYPQELVDRITGLAHSEYEGEEPSIVRECLDFGVGVREDQQVWQHLQEISKAENKPMDLLARLALRDFIVENDPRSEDKITPVLVKRIREEIEAYLLNHTDFLALLMAILNDVGSVKPIQTALKQINIVKLAQLILERTSKHTDEVVF